MESTIRRFEKRLEISRFAVEWLYKLAFDAEKKNVSDKAIQFSIVELLNRIKSSSQSLFGGLDDIQLEDVEEALLYLSKIGALKLEGGFLVLYNAMNIQRIKDNKSRYKQDDYRMLNEFYKLKIQQVHIVGEYANLMVRDYHAALQYVQDYFQMDYRKFVIKYFKGDRANEIQRNLTPQKYKPEIGLLLNIDKDHQEIDELMSIFGTFRDNTKGIFITNRSNKLAAQLSMSAENDFAADLSHKAGYIAKDFVQNGFQIQFSVNGQLVTMNTVGKHNMENALAAIAVVSRLGVTIATSAEALANYEGIYRRHQIIGDKNGVLLIDDYAHNPAKCAASISACQPIAPKVIAWFQPHGYGPTRFLRNDFVQEIAAALRPEDEIWMSEIFYAGGTAVKDISANDLIQDIRQLGKNAYFVENRNDLVDAIRPHIEQPTVLLLMGARDPGLEVFAKEVLEKL
jgi:hypothetical protein